MRSSAPAPQHSGVRSNTHADRHRGVALIVGLILLLLMTLLAIIAMTRATTELMMAANEQYRRRASQAASAAIEDAIARIGTVIPARGSTVTRGPRALVDGSLERFSSATSFAGIEKPLFSGSADKFAALHYTIDGVGTSARGARDEQTQGIVIIAPLTAVADFNQLEHGLP
jgi:type IV pilus assembly protein PilX